MKPYENIATQAHCPICNSDAAYKLWGVSSNSAAQHFVLREAERERHDALVSAIEKLWQGSECGVLRCSSCDFVYSSPYIAGDAQFYELAFQRTGYPEWKWEYQLTFDALQGRPRGFSYLEIGAGNGAFVSRVVPAMTDAEEAYCTEYSVYGRTTIRKLGIQCDATDIRNINRPEFRGYFEVVCLFQVLEHLDALDALFEHLRWLTADKAKLFIAVPNAEHIEYTELHGALLDMPPNHIGRFNKRTFAALCTRWGWELVEHRVERGSIMAAARELCVYRFLRRAQRPNSLENRISRIKEPRLRKISQVMAIAFQALLSIPDLLMINKNQKGASQWVHLSKIT